MTVHQKDIVEIAFYTGRTPQMHPALVVSVDEIFELEGFFYAVTLSTKNIYPEFTFEITPLMINHLQSGASMSGMACGAKATSALPCAYATSLRL